MIDTHKRKVLAKIKHTKRAKFVLSGFWSGTKEEVILAIYTSRLVYTSDIKAQAVFVNRKHKHIDSNRREKERDRHLQRSQ